MSMENRILHLLQSYVESSCGSNCCNVELSLINRVASVTGCLEQLRASLGIWHQYSALDFRNTEMPAEMEQVERTHGPGNLDKVDLI
jgi:hypothetical protein